MKTIRRIFLVVLSVLMLSAVSCKADFTFPGGLKELGDEVFSGVASMTGRVVMSDGILKIGSGAFDGTGIHGLEIPAGTQTLSNQPGLQAVYVLFRGNTAVEGLPLARCIIAPMESAAHLWAESANIPFVPLDALMQHEGYYYQQSEGGLKLLCAVDSTAIGTEADIPAIINDLPVTALSGFALCGCGQLENITLPSFVKNSAALSDAIRDCHGAAIHFEGDEGDVAVVAVTADAGPGVTGGSVTWSVEGLENPQQCGYEYILTKDGDAIAAATSDETSYTRQLNEPGAYQLSVTVRSAGRVVAQGVSLTLFIATAPLEMTLPDTLNAGENLNVQVAGLDGALSYSVLLTREDTGESLGTRTITLAGTVTFPGYALDAGVYRVTGYVYGKDFAMSVPTVRRVTVTGQRRACDALDVPAELAPTWKAHINLTGGSVTLEPPSTAPSPVPPPSPVNSNGNLEGVTAIVRTTRSSPGMSSSIMSTALISGDEYTLSASSVGEQWTLAFALYRNGAWTDWSDDYTVDVVAGPPLPDPTVTLLDPASNSEIQQEDILPGQEIQIQLSDINAIVHDWMLSRIADDGSLERVEYYEIGSSSTPGSIVRTLALPARELSPGVYRLTAEMISPHPGYTDNSFVWEFEIGDHGMPAVEVTLDKTDAWLSGDSVALSIHAEGAQSAEIRFRISYGQGVNEINWGYRALDSDGDATLTADMHYDNRFDGCDGMFCVSVLRDGQWSPWERRTVHMHAREPLAVPVVTIPTSTLQNGADLSFSFGEVPNAEAYTAEVYSPYVDGSVYYWRSGETLPGETLTLPGYALNLPSGTYRVDVTAISSEYRSSTGSAQFTLTGRRSEGPAILSQPDALYMYTSVTFTVDAQDAEEVRVCGGEYDSNDDRPYYSLDSARSVPIQDGAAAASFGIYYYEGTNMSFRFAVKRDGVWSDWTQLRYVVQGLPPVAAAGLVCPPSWQAGEDIAIQITPAQGAENYSFSLYQGDNCIYGTGFAEAPRTVLLAGYRLEPGTYRAEVTTSAEGYSEKRVTQAFDIVGGKGQAPSVTVEQTTVTRYAPIRFQIDCEGAEELVVQRDNDYYSAINAFEQITQWSTSSSEMGEQTYRFAALVEGRWTGWSDPIIVTVVDEPDSGLGELVIDAPNGINPGQDLTVSVSAENATSASVSVYNSREQSLFYSGIELSEPFTVPGYLLPAYGLVTVRVSVYNEYHSRTGERTVTIDNAGVTRPTRPGVTPTAVTVAYGETLHIDVTGIDTHRFALRRYRADRTNNVSYQDYDARGSGAFWEERMNREPGYVWKFAFALYDEDSGMWSPWSSICTVTVVEPDEGQN